MISRSRAARLLDISPDAGPGAVRHAFRRCAPDAHPDRGGDVAAFIQLKAARDRLMQPPPGSVGSEGRAAHGTAGHSPGGPGGAPRAHRNPEMPRSVIDQALAWLAERVTAWEHRRRFGVRDRELG